MAIKTCGSTDNSNFKLSSFLLEGLQASFIF